MNGRNVRGAEVARGEGFNRCETIQALRVEKARGERYRVLLANVENNQVFEGQTNIWICNNCGHPIPAGPRQRFVPYANIRRPISTSFKTLEDRLSAFANADFIMV